MNFLAHLNIVHQPICTCLQHIGKVCTLSLYLKVDIWVSESHNQSSLAMTHVTVLLIICATQRHCAIWLQHSLSIRPSSSPSSSHNNRKVTMKSSWCRVNASQSPRTSRHTR